MNNTTRFCVIVLLLMTAAPSFAQEAQNTEEKAQWSAFGLFNVGEASGRTRFVEYGGRFGVTLPSSVYLGGIIAFTVPEFTFNVSRHYFSFGAELGYVFRWSSTWSGKPYLATGMVLRETRSGFGPTDRGSIGYIAPGFMVNFTPVSPLSLGTDVKFEFPWLRPSASLMIGFIF